MFSARLRFLLGVVLFLPDLYAGTYPSAGIQTFSAAVGITDLGDGTLISSTNGVASIQPNAGFGTGLRLTDDGVGGTLSSFQLPDIDLGKEMNSFTASFRVTMNAAGTPADG